jgi:hypothetical protein
VRTVRVGTVRTGTEPARLVARPGLDVVVLAVANGPVLVLHPETARDLVLSQSRQTRSPRPKGGDVVVPTRLAWPGLEEAAATRAGGGFLGQAVLAAFQVLTPGDGVDPRAMAAAWLASAAVRRCDGRVEAGVYALAADALGTLAGSGRRLDAVPPAADGGPLLVFVHGSFLDTASTFGKLWSLHADTVRRLFAAHGGRVYALDHPTLATGPIANARTLVAALPHGARLRLVTHGRGGLVAEVLARACAADADASTFAPHAAAASDDAPRAGRRQPTSRAAAFAAQRRELASLIREVRAKAIASSGSSASPRRCAARCWLPAVSTSTSPWSAGRCRWPVCRWRRSCSSSSATWPGGAPIRRSCRGWRRCCRAVRSSPG